MSTVDEYDAIAQTVQHYIDGAKSCKGDDMRPAFHESATIFGYAGPDLMAGPIEELYTFNDENRPGKDIHARITSIDLAETVATVRLEIGNWTGDRYRDLFTLLKVDGTWKTINKVFHMHG